jgi:hypothetical protein
VIPVRELGVVMGVGKFSETKNQEPRARRRSFILSYFFLHCSVTVRCRFDVSNASTRHYPLTGTDDGCFASLIIQIPLETLLFRLFASCPPSYCSDPPACPLSPAPLLFSIAACFYPQITKHASHNEYIDEGARSGPLCCELRRKCFPTQCFAVFPPQHGSLRYGQQSKTLLCRCVGHDSSSPFIDNTGFCHVLVLYTPRTGLASASGQWRREGCLRQGFEATAPCHCSHERGRYVLSQWTLISCVASNGEQVR